MNTLRGQFSIQIGSKSFEVLINMNAFRLLTQADGVKLSDFDKQMRDNPLQFIPRILFFGAVNLACREGKSQENALKSLPNFGTWAAYVCEDMESVEDYAKKITESMASPSKKKAKKGGKAR